MYRYNNALSEFERNAIVDSLRFVSQGHYNKIRSYCSLLDRIQEHKKHFGFALITSTTTAVLASANHYAPRSVLADDDAMKLFAVGSGGSGTYAFGMLRRWYVDNRTAGSLREDLEQNDGASPMLLRNLRLSSVAERTLIWQLADDARQGVEMAAVMQRDAIIEVVEENYQEAVESIQISEAKDNEAAVILANENVGVGIFNPRGEGMRIHQEVGEGGSVRYQIYRDEGLVREQEMLPVGRQVLGDGLFIMEPNYQETLEKRRKEEYWQGFQVSGQPLPAPTPPPPPYEANDNVPV